MLTATVAQSLRQGAKAGPLVVLGHGLAEVALIGALAFGLGQILLWPPVKTWTAVGGGLVLVLWGGNTWREATPPVSWGEEGSEMPRRNLGSSAVVAGVITSLASPYWLFWWVVIGFTLVSQSLALGFLGLLAFYSGHILADLAWYTGVSLLVAQGKKSFPPGVYRAVLKFCALFLVGLGVYFFFSGVTGRI